MSKENNLALKQDRSGDLGNGEILEKLILQNDVSSLSPLEKVDYVVNVCKTLSINPMTRPIQLIKFQGKETVYFTKDATEQLRKINKVSIVELDNKMLPGDVYVVTARAVTPDGRSDASTGAISVAGLRGDALGNALMKAETKAKRRVTLSICGLGFLDESEIESMSGAVKVDIYQEADSYKAEKLSITKSNVLQIEESTENKLEDHLKILNESKNVDDLRVNFVKFYSYWKVKKDKVAMNKLADAKDIRKFDLDEQLNQEDIDQ